MAMLERENKLSGFFWNLVVRQIDHLNCSFPKERDETAKFMEKRTYPPFFRQSK
jgi:hypothetical protein